MPYIVTTTRATGADGAKRFDITRRAVATLDEVRQALTALSREHGWPREIATALADSADSPRWSTVGPLPDGTVIEVERVP